MKNKILKIVTVIIIIILIFLIVLGIDLTRKHLLITEIKERLADYNITYLLNGINKEKVNKTTGLLTFLDGTNVIRKYKYETVKNEDVMKPDIENYDIVD